MHQTALRPWILLLLAGLTASAVTEAQADEPAAPKTGRAAKRAPKGQTPEPRLPADLKIVDDIVYKQVGDEKLKLMLFLPQEDAAKKFANAPLVIYIHGGGWAGGDRYKVLRPDVIGVVRPLVERGFVCASIEYRLADGDPTTAFDAAADCKDAVRYLFQNSAKYGVDPERIGTLGSSAGGHLTLVTALGRDEDYPTSLPGPTAKIRCVAAFYPLVSFVDTSVMQGSNFERPQRLLPLLGGSLEEKLEVAKKLSPIDLIRPDSPAILVAHGDADKVLPSVNAEKLRDAAAAKGVACECIISRGAGHGFGGDSIDPTVAEIDRRTVEFFAKHLEVAGGK